jgi:hypothetical protein
MVSLPITRWRNAVSQQNLKANPVGTPVGLVLSLASNIEKNKSISSIF